MGVSEIPIGKGSLQKAFHDALGLTSIRKKRHINRDRLIINMSLRTSFSTAAAVLPGELCGRRLLY
jgi:hypothetical protein